MSGFAGPSPFCGFEEYNQDRHDPRGRGACGCSCYFWTMMINWTEAAKFGQIPNHLLQGSVPKSPHLWATKNWQTAFIISNFSPMITQESIHSFFNTRTRLSNQPSSFFFFKFCWTDFDWVSGLTFTLPSRQLAAEAIYSYKLDTTDGNVKMTGTIWFDKNKDDNQKLLVSMGTQYKIPENKSSFVMRSTFSTQIPTLPKVRINFLIVGSQFCLSKLDLYELSPNMMY